MRKIIALRIASVLVSGLMSTLLGSEAYSSEYFPLHSGIQWNYMNGVEASTGPVQDHDGVEAIPLTFTWPEFNCLTYWLVDDPGGPQLIDLDVQDACYDGTSWFIHQWHYNFGSAIRLFEHPLTPGAQIFDTVSTDYGDLGFYCTIGEQTDLETPYGSLDVFPFSIVCFSEYSLSAEFHLHVDLGPVSFNGALLTEVSGIVGVEQKSWSDIKSLFE